MKHRCSKCNKKGHNKRTCNSKSKKVAKRAKKSTKKVAKKKRPMSVKEKVGRWGKVVARYNSSSSDAKYRVRRKGNSYSCNCPGWRFKKPGKSRGCIHITKAKAAGKRGRRLRSRFCRR